jgi:hypothetical protein
MYGSLTHTEVEWVPVPLLCRRLGIMDPGKIQKSMAEALIRPVEQPPR